MNTDIIVRLATAGDIKYAETITKEMEESAKARGTGIAQRSPEYVVRKMEEGKSIIAVTTDGTWVGYCYIEEWDQKKFVANSGLIVSPPFRSTGVAKEIKSKIFDLSREKYPSSKIFGLTTGLAVMKINSSLGYKPVTYSELTTDEDFWKGCRSCVNFDILTLKERKNCICTAMLFDPAKEVVTTPMPSIIPAADPKKATHKKKREFKGNLKLFDRWVKFKRYVLLRSRKQVAGGAVASEKKNSLFGIFFW